MITFLFRVFRMITFVTYYFTGTPWEEGSFPDDEANLSVPLDYFFDDLRDASLNLEASQLLQSAPPSTQTTQEEEAPLATPPRTTRLGRPVIPPEPLTYSDRRRQRPGATRGVCPKRGRQ